MQSHNRLPHLDTLRGVTLLSMTAYHACWDLVYLFGRDWSWYTSFPAYLWQQSICWTFILLSGFCFHLGHHQVRRGLLALAGSAAVSAGGLLAGSPIWWGVLTLLGTAQLVTIPLERLLKRTPPRLGLACSFCLFLLLRDVNQGYLGFEDLRLASLPAAWYRGFFTAFLGFPGAGFRSADYFSLAPWLFLFWTGWFLFRLRPEEEGRTALRLPLASALGRHSLPVYLLHQPVVFGLLWAAFRFTASIRCSAISS